MNGDPLPFVLPPEAVDLLVDRVAELVVERIGEANGSPWMTRREAAEYLHLPLSRLERDRRIPCHKEGRRVLYHRGEIDRFMLREGLE